MTRDRPTKRVVWQIYTNKKLLNFATVMQNEAVSVAEKTHFIQIKDL